MIQQIFMSEIAGGRQTVLAHGWHPNVTNGRLDAEPPETTDLTHPVTSAAASNQSFRIVFDELLFGNALEEIECRDGSFSRVPEGATPEDIANCAVTNDLLPTFCTGAHAVCLDANGVPVGVKDEAQGSAPPDGAPDSIRMIDGAVKIACGAIDVPVNLNSSFWQPAGNQLVPAGRTAFNSLGPAIILIPEAGRMPSASTCHFEFAPDVTDKQRIRPCIPTGGVEDTDDIGMCEGGDTSGFSFSTESIGLDSTIPSQGSTTWRSTQRTITFILTAGPDPASAAGATVTVDEGGTARTDFTQRVSPTVATRFEVIFPTDLLPATAYTINVSGLTDTFGVVIPPMMLSFTTAP
ncbi:MAG: hypothetical protein R3B06_08485 [Kofleriaceae bacterium]